MARRADHGRGCPGLLPARIRQVARVHAKASMTLDVYADLFDDDLDSVADSLDAVIKPAADPLRTKSTQ